MKRSFFPVVIVLFVCLVAFGFYRGWFTLSSRSPDAGSNKVDVNLSMDKGKMKQDADALKNEASEVIGKVREQTTGSGERTPGSR